MRFVERPGEGVAPMTAGSEGHGLGGVGGVGLDGVIGAYQPGNVGQDGMRRGFASQGM